MHSKNFDTSTTAITRRETLLTIRGWLCGTRGPEARNDRSS
jgi:hypothetical protein